MDFAMQEKVMDLKKEQIVHGQDKQQSDRDHAVALGKLGLDQQKHNLDVGQAQHEQAMDVLDAIKPPEPGDAGKS
jgi:hypothetical protein